MNDMLGSGQTAKGGTSEEQSQEHAHHFSTSRVLFTKKSSWQTLPLHTTYCCGILRRLCKNM
jgi:hypothetical protein